MNAIQTLLTEHLDIWTAADTEKKSGRGRSSANAASVYGIRKLRELILELAVRGKLVPQDASDEPASELLKRILAEKAKLIDDGKIKKDKQLPAISDNEIPFLLPNGWQWVRLGEVVDVLDSLRKPVTQQDREPGPYPYYGASGIVDYVSKYIFDEPLVLVGEDGAKWGRGDNTAFIISGKTWVNNHAHVIRPNRSIVIDEFLVFVLNAMDLEKFITGMTVPKLNQTRLVSISLPIPSIEEQRRIVVKVDELMALCDQLETRHNNAAEAHEKLVSHLLGTLTQSQSTADFSANWQRIAAHFDTLFTTEASIDALKQTLLQLAVMGKLVPQVPNDEPASELLKRTQAEKIKLIAEGKIKKDKPLALITVEETPFELPQGWAWVRLGEALDIVGGVTLGKKNIGTDCVELPYLRVANVQRGHLNLDSIKTVEIKKSELLKYRLENDDLLVTEGGDWDKVGRTAIWKNEIEPCLHQNHIFRMRKLTQGLLSLWVEMYMNSAAKAYFQAASKQTTNLASINMTQLKNCLLAVPALYEQSRIVTKVEEMMALCDQLKFRINQTSQLQQKLADVVVEKTILE